MGKQYKELTLNDIKLIKAQKVFYIASVSSAEVNLAPKGYDSIRILNKNQILFMSYTGSGNRTYRDTVNNGKFTLVFNEFTDTDGRIVRIFCTSLIVEEESKDFEEYTLLFDIDKNIVRNFFIFNIYAVESSCGKSVPVMEYIKERKYIKKFSKSMHKKNKLKDYQKKNFNPIDLNNL